MNAMLEPQIEVLPMNASDLDEILAIEYRVYPFPWGRGNFVDSMNSGYSCWVCHVAGELVGYFVVMMAVDEAHLLNITVKPESQGRGLGLRLLEHLMSRAYQMNGHECFLELRASNQAAYRLYERYGFNEVGRRRDYYPAVGGSEDALVMACTLFE